MEKVLHANSKQKRAGVAIYITDKIDLQSKMVTKTKEGHYIMTKGSIHQEDVIITFTSNSRTFKYIKQTLIELKRETAIQ